MCMEQVTFHFNNCLYRGTIFSSRDRRPFFYWCYFEDQEMIQSVGDCIGFIEKGGDLVTTEIFSNNVQMVVNEIKAYIVKSYYQQLAKVC